MHIIIKASIVVGLMLLAPAREAAACSCAQRPVSEAFWDADRVFTGRAQVIHLGRGTQIARFRVEESFRGPSGRSVEIVGRGIGGSCAYAFVHGTRYLVYAHRAPDGTWSAFFCDPIAPVEEAAEGLAFARAASRSRD